MCTVVLSVGQHPDWPLLLAANRDEMLDRPWLPPGRHWPEQPDILGGQDMLAGGTWLGVNRAGVVAAVLNRAGSLGPAADKRSRGELPVMALAHATAAQAARAVGTADAGQWRSFNLVIADQAGAYCLRGVGTGKIDTETLGPGTHMVTARDPDDMSSPRIARNLPLFRQATPNPPDWSAWTRLLADDSPPTDSAINVAPLDGFGTVSSALVGAGRTMAFLFADGPPGLTLFQDVSWPTSD